MSDIPDDIMSQAMALTGAMLRNHEQTDYRIEVHIAARALMAAAKEADEAATMRERERCAQVVTLHGEKIAAILTATGLTEAQLEVLANGTMTVVLVEPTEAMVDSILASGVVSEYANGTEFEFDRACKLYRAKLAAKDGGMSAQKNVPLAHNLDGIRIYGPHPDWSFNMAVNDCWISSFFTSKEAALSWAEDLNEAERLWTEHGKFLGINHDRP